MYSSELDKHQTESDRMSRHIGEFSESHLLSVAQDVVEQKTSGSVLLDEKAEARIPKFNFEGTIVLVDAKSDVLLYWH